MRKFTQRNERKLNRYRVPDKEFVFPMEKALIMNTKC